MSEDLATLGIKVDSSQTASAATNLDALTAAGARAEQQTDKLTRAAKARSAAETEWLALTGRATATLQANSDAQQRNATSALQAERIYALTGQSASTASRGINALTTEMLGLRDAQNSANFGATVDRLFGLDKASQQAAKSIRSTKADVIAAFKEEGAAQASAGAAATATAERLEYLRSKYTPLYAASKQYENELRMIAEAEKIAALSATQAAAARDRARMSFESLNMPIAAMGKNAQISSFHMMNLGYQVNDVASGIAMGQSPFRILAQQGGQFIQIMQQTGTGPIGLIKAIGVAIGPVGIAAAAGAAAIGTAFAVATQQINQGSGDLTKGMGLTADQLDRVKNRYVTFGDTVKATFQVAWDRIKGGFSGLFDWLGTAYQYVVDATKSLVSTYVGIWVGAFRVLAEAYKMLPTWMGGEGKSFDVKNFTGAFMSGITDTRKAFDDFYSDVAKKARENRVAQIKDEAGKAGSNPDSGKLESARRELATMKLQRDEQERLNNEVAKGNLTSAEAEQQISRTANARRIEAMAAGTTGETYKKLMAIVKELIVVDRQYIDGKSRAALLKANEAGERQLETLKKELSLVRATNRERAVAMAQERAEQELKAGRFGDYNKKNPNDEQKKYVETQKAIALAQDAVRNAQDETNASLTKTSEILNMLDEQAHGFASSLSDAFGQVGGAIGNLITTMTGYEAKQTAVAEQMNELARQGLQNTTQFDLLSRQAANNQTEYYASMIGGAKSFFAEGSAGFKILQFAETAYRAFQFASSVAAMTQKTVEAGVTATANGVIASTGVTAGAASIFAQLGPWGFPVVAAMLGVMAAVGFGGGGGGGGAPAIDVAKERQKTQGAGSVLGDAGEKSRSIANSIDVLAKNTNRDLEYSNQMVISLKAIENSIGSLTGLLARQLQVGGLFDISGLNLGTSGGSGGGLLGGLISGLFGSSKTTTELIDQGIQVFGSTVGQAVAEGIQASAYQTIKSTTEKSGALFGLIGGGTSTSTSTKNTALSGDFTSSIQDIIGGLRSTVLDAATKLGVEGAGAVIDSLSFSIGNISFKDMTGAEIQDALNAVFSKLGDQMVESAIPQVSALQKVGEGALETLSRLVSEYSAVDNAAKMIGFSFNKVGIESLAARDRLVQAAGGLEEFNSQVGFFVDNFLTSAQALAPIERAMTAEMTRLGYVGIKTKDQFAALVQGIDASTASGAALYSALMMVAPAFAKVADAAEELASDKLDLQISILEKTGNSLAATALERRRELASIDASLIPLQRAVYAVDDLNDANDNLADSISKVADAQDKYKSKTDAVKDAQDRLNELLNPTLSAEDRLNNSHSALVEAYNAEAKALDDTISRFNDFKTSLLDFRDSLKSGELAGNNPLRQYAVTRSQFLSTDPTSENFQQVAGDFLAASRVASVSSAQYSRDLAAVKNATNIAISQAQVQIDTAQAQLTALNNSVAGLGVLNETVLSVAEALAAYRVADVAMAVENQSAIVQARADLLAAQGEQQTAYEALHKAILDQTVAEDANATAIKNAVNVLRDLVGTSYGATVDELVTQTEVEKAIGLFISASIASLKAAQDNSPVATSVDRLGFMLAEQLSLLTQVMAQATAAQAGANQSIVNAANAAAANAATSAANWNVPDPVAAVTPTATAQTSQDAIDRMWSQGFGDSDPAFMEMNSNYQSLAAMGWPQPSWFLPGHATGLDNVPYDNYLMRAHAGEAVLTRDQAGEWRGRGKGDNGELLAELRLLRKEVKAANDKADRAEKSNSSLMRRFMGEGDEGPYLKVKDVG